MMLRNTRVGSVALNTRAEAVLTKFWSIQPTRRRPIPIKTMAKTGRVVSRVWAKVASRPLKGQRTPLEQTTKKASAGEALSWHYNPNLTRRSADEWCPVSGTVFRQCCRGRPVLCRRVHEPRSEERRVGKECRSWW